MSYTPPAIGTSGLQIPTYADILAYFVDNYRATYGNAVYLGTDSVDYQDIAVRALQMSEFLQAMQAVYISTVPQTAIGVDMDRLGKLIGNTPRKSASYSTALVTLTGAPGTVITAGVVRDATGNLWDVASPATIGGGGTVAVTATAQTIGNITADIGTISGIATPTAGWTSVTNAAAAVAGQPIEPDSQYRARLMISQTRPSKTLPAGTEASIAAVSGVTRSAVYENSTGTTDANGNPAHSITCVVEGGSSADIAQAIYENHNPGCLMNGTTTVSVVDVSNPGMTLAVSFDVLGYVQVYVLLTVHGLTGFTSATAAAISTNVVSYLNSLGIGQGVVWSELYGAALTARSDPDHPMFSVHAITSGALTVQTTGTTTSGSPTVSLASGTSVVTGQAVVGAGVPAGATVSGISGTTLTLSANATASASGVALSFFTLGTSDIAVAFNLAAKGAAAHVFVNLV